MCILEHHRSYLIHHVDLEIQRFQLVLVVQQVQCHLFLLSGHLFQECLEIHLVLVVQPHLLILGFQLALLFLAVQILLCYLESLVVQKVQPDQLNLVIQADPAHLAGHQFQIHL